jgi:type II secretory pathway component PulK
MKIATQTSTRGFALIIVMMVIVVFSVLAAGLAYSMKVEMQLARNVDSESEMEWLGRSGVELARYVLAEQMKCPNEPYDALNQKWAGGSGGSCSTNGPLADISLDHVQLGRGKFTVKITDLERKVNINFANREIIQQALGSMSVEMFTASTILDSIEDWRDPNSSPHANGAESDYYLNLPEPYIAKDGPFDDVPELLLVRGVTPDIYWGPGRTNRAAQPVQSIQPGATGILDEGYSPGLVDLFSTIGRLQININTASAGVLQLVVPGIDRTMAESIVKERAGLDAVDGTEDDTPYHNPPEMGRVVGLSGTTASQLTRYCSVRSFTFEVTVDVEIDRYKRRLVALVFRNSPRDVQILNMHWE